MNYIRINLDGIVQEIIKDNDEFFPTILAIDRYPVKFLQECLPVVEDVIVNINDEFTPKNVFVKQIIFDYISTGNIEFGNTIDVEYNLNFEGVFETTILTGEEICTLVSNENGYKLTFNDYGEIIININFKDEFGRNKNYEMYYNIEELL